MDETTIQRFWSRVDKSGQCWIWTRGKSRNGYGRFRLKGKIIYAHRFAFEITYGTVLPGLHICHKCDNPPCCNPKHLWAGTPADNMHDRDRKGRGRFKVISYPKVPREKPVPKGSPEYRAKLSEKAKEVWARADYRAKQIAAQQNISPEERQRRRETARAAGLIRRMRRAA